MASNTAPRSRKIRAAEAGSNTVPPGSNFYECGAVSTPGVFSILMALTLDRQSVERPPGRGDVGYRF